MIQQTKELFYKYPKSISVINSILVLDTKEEISLTLSDKFIWVYLLNQYDSYKKQGMKFFETREQISISCCLSLISVKRTLTKLKKLGVIEVQKNNLSGCVQSNTYTKVLTPTNLKGLEFYDINKKVIELKHFEIISNPNEKVSTKTNLTKTTSAQQNKPNQPDTKLTLAMSKKSKFSDLNESLSEPFLEYKDNLPDWAK